MVSLALAEVIAIIENATDSSWLVRIPTLRGQPKPVLWSDYIDNIADPLCCSEFISQSPYSNHMICGEITTALISTCLRNIHLRCISSMWRRTRNTYIMVQRCYLFKNASLDGYAVSFSVFHTIILDENPRTSCLGNHCNHAAFLASVPSDI